MMIPFVLPNVFNIAEKSTKEEYMRLIFPELKKIFSIVEPIQVVLFLFNRRYGSMNDTGDTRSDVVKVNFKKIRRSVDSMKYTMHSLFSLSSGLTTRLS